MRELCVRQFWFWLHDTLGNFWVDLYRPSGPGMRVAQPPAGPVKVFYDDSASDQESPLLQRGMCRSYKSSYSCLKSTALAIHTLDAAMKPAGEEH